MKIPSPKTAAAFMATAAMVAAIAVPSAVHAETATGVDPAASQMLKSMTDYLGSLQQFSVHTENTLEDLLDSGQRVDIDVSANVIISRPNKLRAERKGVVSQTFYYDGKNLTLHDPDVNVYATEPAPGTIEETLDFARESLGLLVPVADLVYRNNYALLMQDVTSAAVLDKTVINGTVCNHLAFHRPDVDFQVWVREGEQPLPCKYVVTDTSTPALISVSTVMSEWNVAPAATDDSFKFVPPEGAMTITFMPLNTRSTAK
ncbi:MAG: DUF2092 domain-containing protein [Arenicellales bacterium]|jgi:hypothetical protein